MFCKLFLVVAAVAQLSLAQSEVPGTLVSSPYAIAPLIEFPTTCDQPSVYSVCDSCSSYMVCASGEILNQAACNGTKPFCSNGACVATKDYNSCPVDPIKCTSEGFFPDPSVCVSYHYCEAGAPTSSVYMCPPNYVYNADTHMCKQKKYASDCVTVTCDPAKIFQKYGTSKTYFAYCKTATEIEMFKCDDGYVFDGSSCLFQCSKVGYFTHPDKTKYYDCYYSGTKLVFTVQTCTAGKEFSLEKLVCLTPAA